MHKCLYMICPTDQLEPVINNRFKGHNYFYTTLGNTLVLDKNAIRQIAMLIQMYSIKEITFILAEDNCIVRDALNNQKFIETVGLKEAYAHLQEHRKNVQNSCHMLNYTALLLSYLLNQKIKELRAGLHGLLAAQPLINGKLFEKDSRRFKRIYSELVFADSINLN